MPPMRIARSIWSGSVSWNSSSSSTWKCSESAVRTRGSSRSRFRARTRRSWNVTRPSCVRHLAAPATSRTSAPSTFEIAGWVTAAIAAVRASLAATHAFAASSLPSSRQLPCLPNVHVSLARSREQRQGLELVVAEHPEPIRRARAARRGGRASGPPESVHEVRSSVAASIALEQRVQVQAGDRQRRDAVARGAVVMLGEDARELAVPVRLHAERAEDEQRLGQRLVGEQLVERALPPVLERNRLLDRVEHLEAGRQRRFERVLGEDPLRERVQRGDRRVVERLQRARVRAVARSR